MTPTATARRATATLLLGAAAAFSAAHAQTAPAGAGPTTDTPEALFVSLKVMDDTVFEQGFNRCNIPAMASALHPDLVH